MQIRKEQGLFLIVLALGAWMALGSGGTKWSSVLRAKEKPYEAAGAPRDCLAPALSEPPAIGRDAFREPSETSPLPPTELSFPELAPLSVVALPLDPGQHPRAYGQLRVQGGVIEQFAFPEREQDADEVPAEPAEQEPAAAQQRPELTYDSVITKTGQSYWGFLRNADKYDLEGKGPFRDKIVLDWIKKETGKVVTPNFEIEAADVRQVRLADTLRNKVERRKRSIGSGAASNKLRGAFIDELLIAAQAEDWAFQEALQQADVMIAAAPGDAAGYRKKAQVFRAQADLGKEYAMYRALPEALQDSPFYHRGLGELMARLGMDIEAERHLREAVAKGPADPRAHNALAKYLLSRGRPDDALAFAEAAHRNRGLLTNDVEQFEAIETALQANLALGRAEEAMGFLAQLPTGEAFGARRAFLAGSVDYAKAEREGALSRFASAQESGSAGPATLARAACLMLDQKWVEAEAGFRSVLENDPLLRARAFAGLGLLYERAGQQGQALAQLEAAAVADPSDPYVQYMLGRERRLGGQLEGAVEALRNALQMRDGLIEAMAELTLVYLAMADAAPAQAAEHLYNARQYVDRLVELDAANGAVPGRASLEYRILQGLVSFRVRDLRLAKEAFESGRDESKLCQIGMAIVDYAQNRVEEARGGLLDLRENLRPDDPYRQHAEQLLAVIDDHAEKEQLRDNFDRSELGDNWEKNASAGLVPRIADGHLVVRGPFSRNDPVRAFRSQPKAGDFLAVEVTIQLAAQHDAKLAVLQMSTQTRRGTDTDFRVSFGFRGSKPYLRILDGQTSNGDPAEPVELSIDASALDPHKLSLQVVAKEEGSKSFVLQAIMDGALVHEQELNKLRRGTSQELVLELLVDGNVGQTADVTFDDFRLVRRKEK